MRRGGCYGDEILRLRCATLRMTCGLGVKTGVHEGRPYGRSGRERGMGPRIREDNGGTGVGAMRECQLGTRRLLRRRDSSTSLRYAQNDMWVGRSRRASTRDAPTGGVEGRGGWVPASARTEDNGGRRALGQRERCQWGRGGCYGDEILRLRCATLRMTCGLGVKTGVHEGRPCGSSGRERGMGPRIRKDNGGTGVGAMRKCQWGKVWAARGWVPHPRGQRRDGRWGNVRVSVGDRRLLRRRDSSTSLRYAQNDMWVGGQDGRPRGTPLRE